MFFLEDFNFSFAFQLWTLNGIGLVLSRCKRQNLGNHYINLRWILIEHFQNLFANEQVHHPRCLRRPCFSCSAQLTPHAICTSTRQRDSGTRDRIQRQPSHQRSTMSIDPPSQGPVSRYVHQWPSCWKSVGTPNSRPKKRPRHERETGLVTSVRVKIISFAQTLKLNLPIFKFLFFR